MEYFGTEQEALHSFEERPLRDGLAEVKKLLGNKQARVFPPGKEVIALAKDHFRSTAFSRAGFDQMPEMYGVSDRYIITITFEDGNQVYVVSGKVSAKNPELLEVGHLGHGTGMVDLRRTDTTIYIWNGYNNGTITEISPTGEESTYGGELGSPAVLLDIIRQILGTFVGRENFIES